VLVRPAEDILQTRLFARDRRRRDERRRKYRGRCATCRRTTRDQARILAAHELPVC